MVSTATSNPLGALATVSGLWIMFFMGDQPDSRGHAQRLHRHAGIGFSFVVGTILACLGSAHFYSSSENFIGVLLFFFVPWSAINLVDYYLVKHGPYDVQSFFKPEGIYGGFQWRACLCYVITLAVQVPFLDQLFYVGPLVKPLGGADISLIAGFGVASLLYLAGARRFVHVQPGAAAAVGAAS